MYERPVISVLIFAASISGLQGQSLESLVQNAVTSAFSRSGENESQRPESFRNFAPFPMGDGFIHHFDTDVGAADPLSERPRGSSAVNALNRFSQSNEPEMNQFLEKNARSGADATRKIVSDLRGNPSFTMRDDGARARFVTTDPEIREVFQDTAARYCSKDPIPRCDPWDPYRTADGSCNNLYDPLLGKSFTPQARILPNAYNDNYETPRILTSNKRGFLPSARVVSNAVLSGPTPNSVRHSTFLTHFGQFIDHDVISTPSVKEKIGNKSFDIVDCCSRRPRMRSYCFPIPVPRNDPHFRGRTCMNMVRHAGSLDLKCTNGVREQQNQRSSFIDGTAIYGFHKEKESRLRGHKFGRLRESDLVIGLLPRHGCPMDTGVTTSYHCFEGGDHRQSETPTLTVMHTTWLRRHNLIADALRAATGITHDETLFQEAKRIVVAELQHITYNEFLPAVLDNSHLTAFNLRSRRYGHDNIYNPNVDPRTFNSFGAAVLRMGHSLVRNVVGHDNGRGRVKTFPLQNHFDKPDLIFDPLCEPGHYPPCHGFEYMARWMSKAPKSRSDSTLVNGIRNHLFEGRGSMNNYETMSFDLGALNIQRGREHGLPPYNAFREFCGRHPAYHFTAGVRGGLEDHSPRNAANLARVYRSPHDIDLYAGGISETPVRGGILGPTFSCLLAYQFSLYKHGDRFWYEINDHENPNTAFTEDQLAQTKQITHAKVLCSILKDDYGDISYQTRLFKRQHEDRNPRIPCTQILNGNPLGFDITPFANQLHLLRGNRIGRSRDPFDRFTGGFSPLHGRSVPLGPRPRARNAPVDVGFRVPLPRNVF